MSVIPTPSGATESPLGSLARPTDRRSFLKWTGASLAAVALIGCEDDGGPTDRNNPEAVMLDFSTDVGVLNFAYALEQLEAAFYTQAVANLFTGATADERQVLTSLRDHEVIHREFLKAALGAGAIPALTPNFDAVNFSSRASVMQTAQTFEDLGVAAYNGAGRFLRSADFLAAAGKIVSVEARHASVIRTLNGANFAPDAFDPAMAPGDVLAAAAPFIRNQITLRNA